MRSPGVKARRRVSRDQSRVIVLAFALCAVAGFYKGTHKDVTMKEIEKKWLKSGPSPPRGAGVGKKTIEARAGRAALPFLSRGWLIS